MPALPNFAGGSPTIIGENFEYWTRWIEQAKGGGWPTSFMSNPGDLNQCRWDSSVALTNANKSNFLHLQLWGQKTTDANTEDLDIAIYARLFDGTNGTALMPLLICRAIWKAKTSGLYTTNNGASSSCRDPAPGLSIDTSADWQMATDFDFSQPSSGSAQALALNPFEANVIRFRDVGALIQIPLKGWNQMMINVKTGAQSGQPNRLLVLAKQR